MKNLKDLLRTAWGDWTNAWTTLRKLDLNSFPCTTEDFMFLFILAKRWAFWMKHLDTPGNPLDERRDYSLIGMDFDNYQNYCYHNLCLRPEDVLAYYDQALPDFSQAEAPLSPDEKLDRQILVETLWAVATIYKDEVQALPDLPDLEKILEAKHWPRPENETENQTA